MCGGEIVKVANVATAIGGACHKQSDDGCIIMVLRNCFVSSYVNFRVN